MAVQVQALSLVPEFAFFDRKQHRKLKKLVALSLVGMVVFVACCISFAMISMISMALGVANSMGVFGDGKLSEYIGYASVLGSAVGMAGSMVWPGGGIGSGYGADGFGVGYSTDTYQAATQLAAPGASAAQQQASMDKITWSQQRDLDAYIAANRTNVGQQVLVNQRNGTAISQQNVVTSDIANNSGATAANQTHELTTQERINQTVTNTTTHNQDTALQNGYGPVSESYADQLSANGTLNTPNPQTSGANSGTINTPNPQTGGNGSGAIKTPVPQTGGSGSGTIKTPAPSPIDASAMGVFYA